MKLFLGLDGGGSKTAAAIVDEEGSELGQGEGGPGNIASQPDRVLSEAIKAAVSKALMSAELPLNTRFHTVCAGMAGVSVEVRLTAFRKLLPELVPAEQWRIVPDYAAAYWGASGGEPGIAVIAGTGAVAYGRNREGQTLRVDGLGYLLGDRGSGFNLGLHALRYTLECMKEGRMDPLSEAVVHYTGASGQSQILQWLYSDFQTARVAGMAHEIGQLAEAGDPAARSLLSLMARRLRYSTREVRHKLWMDRDVPVYPLGGLWKMGDFFLSEFQEPSWRLLPPWPQEEEISSGGRFNIIWPQSSAAHGAAVIASLQDYSDSL